MRLLREQVLARSPEEVFAYFADAMNLQAMTPPWLHFEVLTPAPIAMREGALIAYRLRLHGLPLRWLTRIETWEPPRRFVDIQLRGPYASWHHTHTFEAHPDGTLMRDEVEYSLPFGPLGELARRLLVTRDLERIFEHRRATIGAEMAPPGPSQPS